MEMGRSSLDSELNQNLHEVFYPGRLKSRSQRSLQTPQPSNQYFIFPTIDLYQSQQFEDPEVERSYLKNIAEQGMVKDTRALLILDVALVIQTQVSRTSQCDEIGEQPCPVGFWIVRAVSAVWLTAVVLTLLLLQNWRGFRERAIGRYQEFLFVCLLMVFLLEAAHAAMKDVHMRFDARCSDDHPDMCPNFSWSWLIVIVRTDLIYLFCRASSLTLRWTCALVGIYMLATIVQLFPWYSDTDDEGNTYTVNSFDASYTIPGYIYLLLVAMQCIRCKHLQEVLSRTMYGQTITLHSQHSCVQALLQQYIPARLTQSGSSELLLEQFPKVTILFCSFDKSCVHKFLAANKAEEFFATVASIILEFDLFLESTDLFKLENVGHDYLVTSSVVAFGAAPGCSEADSLARDVRDAAEMVKVALRMVQTAVQRKQMAALKGAVSLDFKVGLHSGPCVGAVAGAQRRFYRLFGDTINTAARMCSHSEFGTVQLSAATNELLSHQEEVHTTLRGEMTVKGKGQMTVYQAVEPAGTSTSVDARIPSTDFSLLKNLHKSLPILKQSPARSRSAPDNEDQVPMGGRSRSLGIEASQPASFTDRRSQRYSVNSPLQAERAPAVLTERAASGHYVASKAFRAFFRNAKAKHDTTTTTPSAVVQQQGQYHKLTGEFVDSTKESAFKASARLHHELEQKLLLGQLIVAMIFMHGVIYIQNEQRPSSSHLYVIPILGGTAAVIQASVLWVVSKDRKCLLPPQTLFWIMFALSCVLLVPLVFVTPLRFPFKALALLLYHHPTYSSSSIVLGLVTLCFVLMYTIAAFEKNESMEGIPNASMAVILLLLVLLVLRRSFFVMARNVWLRRNELSDQRTQLAGLLYDLVPNISACKFVLEQHQEIHQAEDDSLVLIRDLLWVAPLGDTACVLSTDLVNFTPLSEKLGAVGVVNLLHDIWCIMDKVLQTAVGEGHKQIMVSRVLDEMNQQDDDKAGSAEHINLYLGSMFSPSVGDNCAFSARRFHSITPFKIDTVGDAYVVAILLDDPNEKDQQDAVAGMISVAQAIADEVLAYSHAGPHGTHPGSVAMRMGCCLGEAVSGLVGLNKPRYHVMGDALNKATELESKSVAWNVLMDEYTSSHLHHLHGKVLVDLSTSRFKGGSSLE